MLSAGVDDNGHPADAAALTSVTIVCDAHPKMLSNLRLDENALAEARVLARQMEYMPLALCRIYLLRKLMLSTSSPEDLPC